MPDPLELLTPTAEILQPGDIPARIVDDSVGTGAELGAKWRLGWGPQQWSRMGISHGFDPDDRFFPSEHITEDDLPYARDLLMTRSKGEYDAVRGMIQRNRRDQDIASRGSWGLLGDLMAGVADPANLIPIPAVKGIGLVRGSLGMAGALGVTAIGTEALRQQADPTARADEAIGNIALATLLGGLIGAPVGAWGARRARAIRAMERDLGDIDSPNFSLKPRGGDDVRIAYERPRAELDGSRPVIASSDEVAGYAVKTGPDGIRYTSQDGASWIRATDLNRDVAPLSVSDDIAEALGTPEPLLERVMRIDEVRIKAEHAAGRWHDEIAGYTGDATPVERVIANANDFVNFRTMQHLWEQRLPRLADETLAAWKQRAGREAMKEFRSSKLTGDYAGPQGISWLLGRLNFSPVAKAIRTFAGDNVVADLALRLGGDYGWAIKANEFRWSTPPSMLLKGMRHSARYHQWLAEFEQEWLKFASGNQQVAGRSVQGLNVSAAGYALRRGMRRKGGAQVLTHDEFEEMVARAVFEKGDFEVNGFPVNDNARNAAKSFSRMMEEYDELHRAAGNFRDQKQLGRDIKYWTRERTRLQGRVMEWLWGATGRPARLQAAIRVTRLGGARPGELLEGGAETHIFEGPTHEAAIQKMIDELGDEGVTLSEQLTAESYGYTYPGGRPPSPRPPAAGEPPPGTGPAEPTPSGPAGPPPPAPDAAARAAAEQQARYETLKPSVAAGTATPDELAEYRVLDRILLQRAMADFDLRAKSMAAPPEESIRFNYEKQEWEYLDAESGQWTAERPLDPDELIDEQEPFEAYEEAMQAETDRRLEEEEPPAVAVAPYGVDQFAYNPDLKNFRSVGEVLNYFSQTVQDSDYLELIGRIAADTEDIPITIVDRAQAEAAVGPRLSSLKDAIGRFLPKANEILLRGDWGELASGTNPEVVLHEALHGATLRRIAQAQADRRRAVDSPYVVALDELEAFHANLVQRLKGPDAGRMFEGMDLSTRQNLQADLDNMTGDIHEVMTYALTHKPIRDWLKSQPADAPSGWIKTKFDELLAIVARLLGYDNPTAKQITMLDELLGLTDRFTALEQPLLPGEVLPGMKAMADRIHRPANEDIPGGPLAGTTPLGTPADFGEAWGQVQTLLDEYRALLSNRDLRRMLADPAVGDIEKEVVRKVLDERTAAARARAAEMLGLDPDDLQGKSRLAHEGESFISVGDAIDQRVRRLSPRQRGIYDQRASALEMADQQLAKANADLKTVTDQPHRFEDANGRPEAYYHRIWDKGKAATEREQLTRIITAWFGRDSPDGARERAELAIDNILNEDPQLPGDGAMSAMHQRVLNIPNSFRISDPEFGDIGVSDFIDKRILQVGEHYVRRSGVKIEAAKMFGDAELRAEKARLREYLLERYYEPATTDAGRRRAMARIQEAEGWLDITRKSVLGTLRTTDPHRLDNRIARGAKDLSTLGVMGKVVFASMPEILRPGMVNGFGTYFRVLFMRYLDDLSGLKGSREFLDLTAELNDLALNQHHVQAMTIQDGEPSLGGTRFERWISERVPGLYKISGLTSLTTWQKTMTGLAAQHSVMADARLVGDAIGAGGVPDPDAMFRLNAMGISPREALLLSRMPVEFKDGGKLIMPAVDNWKELGIEGRQAREALLNGIHAEMRRTIVTPSIGDRSTVFNGVWTRKGKVVGQTDIMTIPMQFLSYGMGAHNKLLTSAIQGRDRSLVLGMFYLFLGGILANYLKSSGEDWRRKEYSEILLEGLESSGIGGFWFTNLNTQLERVSNQRLGLRPALGIEGPYGAKMLAGKPDNVGAAISGLGAAPGYFYDLSRAFWDTSISASQRAQIIRKGVPYNNVHWWDETFSKMAGEIGRQFESK